MFMIVMVIVMVLQLKIYVVHAMEMELRVMIATVELGVSPKSAIARVKTNSISKRVDKITLRLKFRVIPVPPTLLESLASAFLAIADPRYNGQPTLANLAIDALPK